MKIIKEDYSLGKQSVNLCKIIEGDNGMKIKIDIKSDSYDFQSYARISVFEPQSLAWNNLSHIPYANMKTPHKLCHTINPTQSVSLLIHHFQKDILSLTNEAEAILGDNFSAEIKKTNKVTKKNKP